MKKCIMIKRNENAGIPIESERPHRALSVGRRGPESRLRPAATIKRNGNVGIPESESP